MKNIINKSSLFAVVILVLLSCRDESLVRVPTFGEGPNIRIVPDATTTSIDFFSDYSQAKIKFDLYSESKNIQLVDLRVVRTSGGVTSPEVSIKTFTQADIDAGGGIIKGTEITLASVVTALNVSGGLAGLKGGDVFTFRNYTTLNDGTIYPSKTVGTSLNLSSAIQNAPGSTSFTLTFVMSMVCPSALEGTYTATQSVTDNADWFEVNSTNQVTITKVAGTTNQYLVSDITAGGYFACCASSGFKLNQPATISDVCREINVIGSSAQVTFGQGAAKGELGSYYKTLIIRYDDVSNKSRSLGYNLVTRLVKN